MNRIDWCREEVLQSHRGGGVGSVLPQGWVTRRWTVVFLLLLLGLVLVTLVPTRGGIYLAGRIVTADDDSGRLLVEVPEWCSRGADSFQEGATLKLRARLPFGSWEAARLSLPPDCPGSNRLVLAGATLLDASPGTKVLVRIAEEPRTLLARLMPGPVASGSKLP